MKAKVTRYPNNEIRVAVYQERSCSSPSSREEPRLPVAIATDEGDLNHTPVNDFSSDQIECERTFNIKSKVDTGTRRLHLSLSRYGKRQILRAGSCFSKESGTERLLLTGTLPGSGLAAFRALAQNSTSITKKLTNWLTRREAACKWMYTWEFQGRGALHLHLVCEVSLAVAEYVKDHFKDEWNRLLRSVSDSTGVDLYSKTANYRHDESKTQADVTVCDREPSRYISKYISKSSTHAKGFCRFPPKQWYQISRSLLRDLRSQTQIYEADSLTYRQARLFVEDAKHNLEQSSLSGGRWFDGATFAWSGYGYSEHFDISEWSSKMKRRTDSLMGTATIMRMGVQTLKNYPRARCWMRQVDATATEMLTRMESLTEKEMLTVIATVMTSLTTSFGTMRNQTSAAMFLTCSIRWWEKKFGGSPYTSEFVAELDKICNNYLTG